MKSKTKNNYRYYETKYRSYNTIYRVDTKNKKIHYHNTRENCWMPIYADMKYEYEDAKNILEKGYYHLTEEEVFLKLL